MQNARPDPFCLLAEASTTKRFEFEQTFTYGQTQSETREVAYEWEIPFTAPGNMRTTAFVTILEAEVNNVPFTFDVELYEIVDQIVHVVKTVKQTATFSGNVLSNQVLVEVKSVPIEGERL